jgi:hypothetical protein
MFTLGYIELGWIFVHKNKDDSFELHNYMYTIANITNKTLFSTKLSRSFHVLTDSMSFI